MCPPSGHEFYQGLEPGTPLRWGRVIAMNADGSAQIQILGREHTYARVPVVGRSLVVGAVVPVGVLDWDPQQPVILGEHPIQVGPPPATQRVQGPTWTHEWGSATQSQVSAGTPIALPGPTAHFWKPAVQMPDGSVLRGWSWPILFTETFGVALLSGDDSHMLLVRFDLTGTNDADEHRRVFAGRLLQTYVPAPGEMIFLSALWQSMCAIIHRGQLDTTSNQYIHPAQGLRVETVSLITGELMGSVAIPMQINGDFLGQDFREYVPTSTEESTFRVPLSLDDPTGFIFPNVRSRGCVTDQNEYHLTMPFIRRDRTTRDAPAVQGADPTYPLADVFQYGWPTPQDTRTSLSAWYQFQFALPTLGTISRTRHFVPAPTLPGSPHYYPATPFGRPAMSAGGSWVSRIVGLSGSTTQGLPDLTNLAMSPGPVWFRMPVDTLTLTHQIPAALPPHPSTGTPVVIGDNMTVSLHRRTWRNYWSDTRVGAVFAHYERDPSDLGTGDRGPLFHRFGVAGGYDGPVADEGATEQSFVGFETNPLWATPWAVSVSVTAPDGDHREPVTACTATQTADPRVSLSTGVECAPDVLRSSGSIVIATANSPRYGLKGLLPGSLRGVTGGDAFDSPYIMHRWPLQVNAYHLDGTTAWVYAPNDWALATGYVTAGLILGRAGWAYDVLHSGAVRQDTGTRLMSTADHGEPFPGFAPSVPDTPRRLLEEGAQRMGVPYTFFSYPVIHPVTVVPTVEGDYQDALTSVAGTDDVMDIVQGAPSTVLDDWILGARTAAWYPVLLCNPGVECHEAVYWVARASWDHAMGPLQLDPTFPVRLYAMELPRVLPVLIDPSTYTVDYNPQPVEAPDGTWSFPTAHITFSTPPPAGIPLWARAVGSTQVYDPASRDAEVDAIAGNPPEGSPEDLAADATIDTVGPPYYTTWAFHGGGVIVELERVGTSLVWQSPFSDWDATSPMQVTKVFGNTGINLSSGLYVADAVAGTITFGSDPMLRSGEFLLAWVGLHSRVQYRSATLGNIVGPPVFHSTDTVAPSVADPIRWQSGPVYAAGFGSRRVHAHGPSGTNINGTDGPTWTALDGTIHYPVQYVKQWSRLRVLGLSSGQDISGRPLGVSTVVCQKFTYHIMFDQAPIVERVTSSIVLLNAETGAIIADTLLPNDLAGIATFDPSVNPGWNRPAAAFPATVSVYPVFDTPGAVDMDVAVLTAPTSPEDLLTSAIFPRINPIPYPAPYTYTLPVGPTMVAVALGTTGSPGSVLWTKTGSEVFVSAPTLLGPFVIGALASGFLVAYDKMTGALRYTSPPIDATIDFEPFTADPLDFQPLINFVIPTALQWWVCHPHRDNVRMYGGTTCAVSVLA